MKSFQYGLTYLLLVVFLAACGGDGYGGDDGGGTNLTTTVTYPFNDFTGVSVVGPFSVSIVPGPYFIQITVDSGLHRRLDVREEGQLLIVGFDSPDVDSQIRDVVIVMPTLASINFAGIASGSISDFSGSVLNVDLAGNSVLEGQNVRFDFLMVNAAEMSRLLMEDVSPIPAADVRLAGLSSATINLVDHAVLTGRVEGTSTLSYYGSNVTIDVFTEDDGSSVTRVGDSRP